MEDKTKIKILALYAVYRELCNTKKDIYDVISELLKHVIVSKGLYNFSIPELIQGINEEFGFDIPVYVIKSSLKRIDSVVKKDGSY